MNKVNVAELAQAIIAAQMYQGVIVIDTLNQASPAADENSSQDMGIIIKHLKLLQEMTGGIVLIIHHTGKNTSQGPSWPLQLKSCSRYQY
jgi:RecA-family ATPase